MVHGRLDPINGASDIDGNPVDDWGFDGPSLYDVVCYHFTYGKKRLIFATDAACREAQRLTGWKQGHGDNDLTVPALKVDVLPIFNPERQRTEYFGDWGLDDTPRPLCGAGITSFWIDEVASGTTLRVT